ncbi:unnamed protein product [Adineta ricciae]|uniref:G-protein coupled receptors family 1 profile domain-containing protein n=1 Tax=Adineta ricciae TaxID=249248 RepID=A0A816BNM7_ADIRI|nr:unnamed protein product [Adineta ricciae]
MSRSKLISNSTNNLTIIQAELWFIPFDIIMIICTSLTILLGMLFLIICITNRTCWSIQMLLTCNICVAEIFLGCALLNMALFTFEKDFQLNIFSLTFCFAIGFCGYVADCAQNYSYLLIAIYRYISVVYPTRIVWLSAKFQLVLILIQWIFCSLYVLPVFLTGHCTYNIDNQICQIPLSLSVPMVYVGTTIYFIPNFVVLFLYMKLTRYVHKISIRATPANTLFHARRELRLVQRTLILSNTLIILGVPYAIFMLMSFFTTPPKYHFRIAYIFVDLSLVIILVMLYYFTMPVKTIIVQKFTNRNAVEPIRQTART